MSQGVAYLAEGKLFVRDAAAAASSADAPARLVESPFVQQQLDRSAQQRQRNEWKGSNDMLWGGMSGGTGGPGGLLGGRVSPAGDGDARKVRMTALAAGGKPGELIYALQSGSVGGLFVWDDRERAERRLFHRNQFAAADLSVHPTTGALALAVAGPDGTANVATMDAGGKGVREVTEGDSLDESPAWVPPAACGDKRVLVYQSAGVGRNAAGHAVDRGPYAVLRLDLDRGDVETLLEDDATDYLLPRVSADGSLWFIRRPYQPHAPAASPLKVAADVVLFPFRLAAAFVHFFNFFSLMFRRKPLLTAGGPKKEGPDARYLMLWGKLVDAEKVMRSTAGGGGGADAPLVPKAWELVRRSADGAEVTMAAGVLSYDLCPDGSVVYADGSAVYRLDPAAAGGAGGDSGGGKAERVCRGKLIERVVAVA
jgi:hypothetical protein